MFAVVYIVCMDHTLQIPAALGGPPLQTLMDNDIMEDEVKEPVTKNTQTYGNPIRIIFNL
jgi:hypothetical protein